MLTLEDLKGLATVQGPCLTIYQPLRDDYSSIGKPVTRITAAITAAIQDAARLLAKKGFSSAESEEFLRPLLKVALNTRWEGRKGSLVLFRSPGYAAADFWPEPVPRRIHFGTEFDVLPLLPGLLTPHDFWLLSLSLKSVRLFRGSSKELLEIPLPPGTPSSLTSPLDIDTTCPANEVHAERLHDFLKRVERGIRPILANDPHPLILAGVTRELAEYRRVNTYSPVLDEAIHGNPGPHAQLYIRGRQLLAGYAPVAAIEQELETANSRGLLAVDPLAIMHAARAGRVRELFLSPGSITRKEALNRAVFATLRHSGTLALRPSGHPVAAVLRYLPAGQAPQHGSPAFASP